MSDREETRPSPETVLAELERRFKETGNGFHLLDAIEAMLDPEVSPAVPKDLRKEIQSRVEDFKSYRVHSLDAAFGISARSRNELRGFRHYEIARRVIHQTLKHPTYSERSVCRIVEKKLKEDHRQGYPKPPSFETIRKAFSEWKRRYPEAHDWIMSLRDEQNDRRKHPKN